jgi:hypothetical protein
MALLPQCRTAAAATVIAALWTLTSARTASAADAPPVQEMNSLPVRVVDPAGQPVAGAKVIPWALRCSQGHGWWRPDGFGRSNPPELFTNEEGRVEVPYPQYAVPAERVRTTQVTLSIDHPEYAYVMYGNIDVPRIETEPHTIELARGAVVEIVPEVDGKAIPLDDIYLMWSDGRADIPGIAPQVTEDGALRLPPIPAGPAKILVVRLDGGRATHFGEIADLELADGQTVRREVELQPALRVEGKLSENVPRPVKNGRISYRALPDSPSGNSDGEWFSWRPVAEDGTFVIDGWPVGKALQLVALCDGFSAETGKPPADSVAERNSATLSRPQLFLADELDRPLVIPMTALASCEIEVVNEEGMPLSDVKVGSNPSVHWWYNMSQIYCGPLVSGEKYLVDRAYRASVDKRYPDTFSTTTAGGGHAVLQIPASTDNLYAKQVDYELPILRGKRRQEIQLVGGETTRVKLVMQPKGSDYLGEWDKLAGILFGCTGEECRRLLEDEGFRNKMTEVRLRLDSAEDPTDPSLLSGAFAEIADAFDELGDQEEVHIWRRKATEQKAKLKSSD